MNAPDSSSTSTEKGRKPRAVVFGGGIGMFPPLMHRFEQEFEIVANPRVSIPLWYQWVMRLLSIRWPRNAWYRKWRYYLEKTPTSFHIRTRIASRQMKALEGQYDVVFFFGAMYAPGASEGKPIFLFTDSCRWLSSQNKYDEVSHFHSEKDRKEWLALEGQVYKSASRIFVGSDFVRDAMIAHYGVPARNVVTTGFGASEAFARPYEKVFDGKTILYVGKGDFEKKGGLVLMKAFEKVRKALPDAQLHIVGQPRIPATEGVTSHGFIRDREQLAALMRSAHVLTLPSLVDRFGIALVEAMAASTPCVASDYGPLPRIVGDAGIIAPCGDVDALAAALLKILTDKDLARTLGERGRSRFEKIYNWDTIWQTVHREMHEVLD